MSEHPWAFQQIEPATWAYVSSLVMLALFFKFSRIWSIRNLDLCLLVLLAPGLLLYHNGVTLERSATRELLKLGHPVTLSLTAGGQLEGRAVDPAPPPRPQPGDSVAPPPETPNDSRIDSQAEPASATGNPPPDAIRPAPRAAIPDAATAGEPPTDLPADGTNGGTAQTPDGSSAAGVEAAGNVAPESEVAAFPAETEGLKRHWLAQRKLSHSYLYAGFLFLLGVGLLFVVRLFLDQLLVRRPLLETNLSIGGLWLLLFSLLTYLIATITTSAPTRTDVSGAQSAVEMLEGNRPSTPMADQEMGPAYPLLHLLPVIPTMMRDSNLRVGMDADQRRMQRSESMIWVAKLMAIVSQLAIVAGLIWIGGQHFSNWQNGVGMATLYLMLPYTIQMSGAVDHVLPAALLLWAVVLYRQPFWAGILFGLTMGLVYYPIFLLALWLSFYWERGVGRFLGGVGLTVVLMIISLLLFSSADRTFVQNLQAMFGVWLPRVSGLKGIWEFGWDPWFRLPILVAFVSLGASMVAWPLRKTWGTLAAYSAALLVAVQFWHGYGGGLFMAWYLPLTIATIFRPSVHDRVAKNMVS